MNIGTMFKTQTGKSIVIFLTEKGSLAFWTRSKQVDWYFNLPYEYYKSGDWVEQ